MPRLRTVASTSVLPGLIYQLSANSATLKGNTFLKKIYLAIINRHKDSCTDIYTINTLRASLCARTPLRPQDEIASNLVERCVYYQGVFMNFLRDLDPKVKVTARSNVKFTFRAISRSDFKLELQIKN